MESNFLFSGLIPPLKTVERIDQVKEGPIRNHMTLPNGRIHHSAFYSILNVEWQDVKKRLVEMLARQVLYRSLLVGVLEKFNDIEPRPLD